MLFRSSENAKDDKCHFATNLAAAEEQKAKVVLVTDHGTICSISKKSLVENQKKVKKAEVEIEK